MLVPFSGIFMIWILSLKIFTFFSFLMKFNPWLTVFNKILIACIQQLPASMCALIWIKLYSRHGHSLVFVPETESHLQ